MATVIDTGLSAIAQLLGAIAWPLVALVLGFWLLPELKQILRRIAESRSFKVKVGDKELTIQEATDGIQKVVGSLIDAEATRAPNIVAPAIVHTPSALRATPHPESVMPSEEQLADVAKIAALSLRRVLWVDDKPNGVALEMARLKDWGVRIDEARTTDEALQLFKPGKYSLVITDMYRQEQGVRNADAGMDLLKELKSIDPDVVVIAYCASSSARQFGALFQKSGGTAVTSAPVELFELLKRYLAKD